MKDFFTTNMGDKACFGQDALIIRFNSKRHVASTADYNGGYREDLDYIFNHSCIREWESTNNLKLRGDNLEEHFQALAVALHLPADKACGLSTAARIENNAIVSLTYQTLEVTAIVTAGIDHNAGRAGDPAGFNEFTNEIEAPFAGTINIILLINANLSPGVLTRAIVTATEAKTAALQELLANSMYSEDLATGSGTDGIIAVSNPEADLKLYISGKHAILGELIGRSVKQAVKEALKKQSGMDTVRQSSLEWQNKRYGITAEKIKSCCHQQFPDRMIPDAALDEAIQKVITDNRLVAGVAAIIHLIDQYRWGLLQEDTLLHTGLLYLNELRRSYQLAPLHPSHASFQSKQNCNTPNNALITTLILTCSELALTRLLP